MTNLTCPHCRHGWSVFTVTSGFSVLCPACGMPVDLPNSSERITDSTSDTSQSPIEEQIGPIYEKLLSPPALADEIGRLGPYRVLELLGEGGMGFVFRAEDTKLKREVALKVMRPEVAMNAISRQRFLREAQAAAALNHDHILQIYQVDDAHGIPYIAMPLLKGESLQHLLLRERTVPIHEAVRITRETADGLASAHERGFIHRDIKPANLWLESPEGHVKILDFGLARHGDHRDSLTSSGAIIGSPAYMAPEQAAGENVDARADLFSLGCVLYQMLTGRKPFDGRDVMAILSALANQTPSKVSTINPGVPAELDEIVSRLLEKEPAKRFAGAKQVADALDSLDPLSLLVNLPASKTERDNSPNVSATLLLSDDQIREIAPARKSMRWLFVAAIGAVLAMIIAIVVWRANREYRGG